MDLESIKAKLKIRSIYQERWTSVANGLASALAPRDSYDREALAEAMHVLGQADPENLTCVYCDAPAQHWDHLFGTVKSGRFSGYGHVIGNLVPACHQCNTKKGGKTWEQWCILKGSSPERVGRLRAFTELYPLRQITDAELQSRFPEEMRELDEIREELRRLLIRADEISKRVQSQIAER